MSCEMPSHITTGDPPHGLVTVKFLNRMFSQIAFGLHVSRATARPYFPELYPEKFSKRTLVMFTRDGKAAQVVALICAGQSLFLVIWA